MAFLIPNEDSGRSNGRTEASRQVTRKGFNPPKRIQVVRILVGSPVPESSSRNRFNPPKRIQVFRMNCTKSPVVMARPKSF